MPLKFDVCNLDDVHGCVDGDDDNIDAFGALISSKCNFCSCVHSLVEFEWSHRRKSYAIFEAIFLNPMLVPAQRVK